MSDREAHTGFGDCACENCLRLSKVMKVFAALDDAGFAVTISARTIEQLHPPMTDVSATERAREEWLRWRGSGLPVGNRDGMIAVSELVGAIERGDALAARVTELETALEERQELREALEAEAVALRQNAQLTIRLGLAVQGLSPAAHRLYLANVDARSLREAERSGSDG